MIRPSLPKFGNNSYCQLYFLALISAPFLDLIFSNQNLRMKSIFNSKIYAWKSLSAPNCGPKPFFSSKIWLHSKIYLWDQYSITYCRVDFNSTSGVDLLVLVDVLMHDDPHGPPVLQSNSPAVPADHQVSSLSMAISPIIHPRSISAECSISHTMPVNIKFNTLANPGWAQF